MIVRITVVALVALIGATGSEPQAQSPADTVLINGVVLTVDRTDSVAQAVAITGGKITAVGTTAQIKAMAGPKTDVIDLRGRAVTPGLIDTHVHFSAAASLFTVDLGDADVKSIEEVKKRVAAQVAKLKPGEWVRGRGWDEGKYAERRYITAADLDAVAPNNPVWLTHTTGHYGVANSYAMKIAEIRPTTADPPAGTIDRDAKGAPTGVFKESAMGLVSRHVPPLSRDQEKQGIAEIVRQFNREGMTGAKDPGMGATKWELYQELLKEGQLTVRVFALWSGARRLEDKDAVMARVKANPRQPRSRQPAACWCRAASRCSWTAAAARAPRGCTGLEQESQGDRQGQCRLSVDRTGGLPADRHRAAQRRRARQHARHRRSRHRLGDRHLRSGVEGDADAGLRHGLIHANTPTDRAIDAMARLQRDYDAAYPESSAGFMWWIGDNYAGNFGPQRNLRMKPFQTYVRKGIQWGGSSDYPVTPFAGALRRVGVGGAADVERHVRRDSRSEPRNRSTCAPRCARTRRGRRGRCSSRIGSARSRSGKDADLAVWDRNPYAVPTDQLKDMRCELTLVRGTHRFSARPDGSKVP